MGKLIGSAIAIIALALSFRPIGAVAQSTALAPLPPVPAATARGVGATEVAPTPQATPAAVATPTAATHGAAGVARATAPLAAATPVASVRPVPPPSIDHVFYGNPPISAHATAAPIASATPLAGRRAAAAATGVAAAAASTGDHTSAIPKPALRVAPPALDALAPRSIDHVFYGRPAGSPPEVATAPAVAVSPAALASPAAAPTAVAAIIPRLPPVLPTHPNSSAPTTGAFSPTPTNTTAATGSGVHAEDVGLRLYLSDPLSARSSSYNWSLFAFKSHHEMQVFYKRQLFETLHAVFGRSRFGGPKQWEGDRRTPEGDYLIVSKHRSARFRWFLKINYPNAIDQANFLQLRSDGDIPRGLHEGGSVGIHGTDLQILNDGNVDWTTGCISVDNSAISELARLLPLGTLVVIKP
jgi:L,D-transpeptidase catalytic domain